MTAAEVIERLCKLQAEVWHTLGLHSAADCICGKSGFGAEHLCSDSYRNDGEALEFIEKATREALAKRGEHG